MLPFHWGLQAHPVKSNFYGNWVVQLLKVPKAPAENTEYLSYMYIYKEKGFLLRDLDLLSSPSPRKTAVIKSVSL